MRCANGSPIKIIGHTMPEVDIGGNMKRMKFTVVDEVFLNVIVGLRQMKQDNITIHPYDDGIDIEGTYVPFLSKIQAIKNKIAQIIWTQYLRKLKLTWSNPKCVSVLRVL